MNYERVVKFWAVRDTERINEAEKRSLAIVAASPTRYEKGGE